MGVCTAMRVDYLLEIILCESTGGEGRCAHTDTSGSHGRHITRDGVLVGSHVGKLQHTLHSDDYHQDKGEVKAIKHIRNDVK